ncbi:Nicotinate dehydrogenase large molybdopterin subunit [Pelotomaculum sp. FP]|uniref:xanthine dehydrogenase family protein molybdopterin-binding subunit n=1 Tax=Pelotomaculum sp. FP TaxID=261474 RepID=UPI001064B982|nr:molybdopterin cofactor-binding domain-containing protein [Pelotomaculum sp. FP]TEB13043.1 Nicotinate dehydrogenase large molybdopterin subunit [Pelotomaculum sp. FP]
MLNYVGKSIPKYDVMGHVTGKTVYPSDVKMPGMLICKTLRSPYKRARIHSIDISEALKVKGVHAVITKDDVPYNKFAMYPDQDVLAEEIVRFKGQNIAAVAADDKATALEALSKIKLDIEELPAVVDPREAMKEGAPLVRPEGNRYLFDGKYPTRKIRKGNIEEGFAEADFIVEGSYRTTSQEHAPLETCSSLAYIDGTGRLVIHSKSQGLFFTQWDLANVFQIPLSKLKLVGGTIGGGFGGMLSIHTDHIAGLLALKTRRPVKFAFTREDEMLHSSVRNPWFFKYKDGIRKDGVITARQVELIHDCGGYSEMGMYVLEKSVNYIAGPNKIKNVWVDGTLIYTNKMPSGAMRGFGVNVGQFAEQLQTEKLARTVGISPFDIRFVNSFKEGDLAHAQNPLVAVSGIEVLQKVAKMAGVELPEKYLAMSSKDSGEGGVRND